MCLIPVQILNVAVIINKFKTCSGIDVPRITHNRGEEREQLFLPLCPNTSPFL